MTGEVGSLFVRKFSSSMVVSAGDLAFAEEMREHERRLAAMTPEQRAERQAQRDAERAAALAAAAADWQAVCDRLAGNAPALAALAIHKPVDGASYPVQCAHPVDGWEAEPDEWPCEAFTAIKDAR